MKKLLFLTPLALLPGLSRASEADLKIPALSSGQSALLYWGFAICFLGIIFAFFSSSASTSSRSSRLNSGSPDS